MLYDFYEYIVNYWDDTNKKLCVNKGVTMANTYCEAVYNIEHYYDNINEIFISSKEGSHCYEFPEDPNSYDANIFVFSSIDIGTNKDTSKRINTMFKDS